MGRKKKKQVEIKPKSETVLEYTGSVTVSLLRKGKVVKKFQNHNDGTNNLFKFILNCLAGEYYDVDRPKWIIPYYTEGSADRYSISAFIPINSIKIIDQTSGGSTSSALSYRCLISSSYLGGEEVKIHGLLFYSDNGKKNAGDYKTADDPIDDNYQMKMSFGDIDEDEFQKQDILVEWQVRIVSAKQVN